MVETTHSFNEKSKIYEYFGNSHLYDEAKAEDNTFFRQGATKRFINNFHKCDKAKAIRAMQELIADHILLREDAFSKIIPGFGFDEIEAIIINWIDKSIFKKTSSNYILRDLYETKVLKTNNITIKLDSNSADVKELSGQTEIIDSKEVNISLDSGVGNNISEVFKSIGVGVNPTKEVFEIDVSSLATSVDDTVIDVIQNDPLDEITARFNSDTTVELDTKDVSNMIMKFIKGDDTLSFQFVIHEELIFQEGIKSGINSYKKKWKDAHKGIDLLGKWQDDE